MITGGFGTTIDLQSGEQRRWYMGEDGIKRWLDSDEPVNTQKESKQCSES